MDEARNEQMSAGLLHTVWPVWLACVSNLHGNYNLYGTFNLHGNYNLHGAMTTP